INEKPCKVHTFLETGDVVFYPKISATSRVKQESAPPLEILYEDDDLIVINKPAGLIVHRSNTSDLRANVADILLKSHRKMKQVGDASKDSSQPNLRPGIVHRLDKDVSGVMVVAKTQPMFEQLKKQFQDRTTEKKYLALVYGKLPKDHDVIQFAIARSKRQGRMVARTGDQEGKEAITSYDVVERYKNATLVKIQIHTGRTHQIRVHFLAINHPVMGDKLYHIKNMRHIREKDFGRIFLHADSLTLRLLNGKQKTFLSPLPIELKNILATFPKT
ncbi:MAG: RluA family pseudouridine synthase, partial [Patescibacteria group bacterium]